MSYLNWHVGMKVVCVNAGGLAGPLLTVGAVYTVRELEPEFVHLAEPSTWSPTGGRELSGWTYSRFRPVQTRDTDIAVFTSMLTSTKSKVPA